MTVTFDSFLKLLHDKGSPQKLLLHPSDFWALAQKFDRRCLVFDSDGCYLLVERTRVYPMPREPRPDLVDLSTKSMEWE